MAGGLAVTGTRAGRTPDALTPPVVPVCRRVRHVAPARAVSRFGLLNSGGPDGYPPTSGPPDLFAPVCLGQEWAAGLFC